MILRFSRSGLQGVMTLLALFLFAGCERSDPRIKKSTEALHWSGGNAEDQRVRDSLLAALERATSASLAKSELVSVSNGTSIRRNFMAHNELNIT